MARVHDQQKESRTGDTEPQIGEASPAGRRSARLRLRAAWMYYVEEMTQNEVADALGIGRVTVARLLTDARALHEVRISLSRDLAELPRLEIGLQKLFSLKEAVVAPVTRSDSDPVGPIGAATGYYISELLRPNMKIGLGWGRTLSLSLAHLEARPIQGLSVFSLLGGVTKARTYNPSEFAWQFARAFQAECYLIAAPAIVDSLATKQALIERCGLKDVYEMAQGLDTVVLSVGSMKGDNAPTNFGFLSDKEKDVLASKGAVGNILYHYFDIDGRLVDHPINDLVMSLPLDVLRAVPNRILTSGGPDKIEAMRGALRLLQPTVCITDEQTAASILDTSRGLA